MSPESTLPLISCIMPTYNRREFVPHAIRYFLRQDYPNKELIVIDDGEDAVADLIPLRDDIHYYRLNSKLTLGAKLNMACEYARGTFIAHWDDDDWYAPRRLQYQVRELQNGGTSLCGINHLLYFDLIRHHALQYVYPANQRVWLIGSSLFYHKDLWAPRRFADINVGMDGLFVWAVPRDRITVLEDPTISVHMIHDRNVSPKKTGGSWWHAYPLDEIQKILQADWPCYVHDGFSAEVQPALYPLPPLKPTPPHAQKTIRNIYACLVHEHEDCIIDLVRNLHYHDPASVILLYNGGSQADLKGPDFPYGQFGAIWLPRPVAAKWGYLHQFALDCMAFALEHLSFDILTIVDSDQLCLRSGYTAYLSGWISSQSAVGMLSNMPERVTRENLQVHPAIQAWREFELWKPFLQQFPGGEDKFVHWTFWPSTVFTADAARDLVQLFRENTLLQGIMQQTKIWATEEIILPTLVRLLGYDIAANPCSYDFVKYKKVYSLPDLRYSMDKSDAYWMHPIERNYNNLLRHHIRHSCHHYQKPKETPVTLDLYTPELLLPLAVMNKVKSIEGWLGDAEAELLLAVAIKACESLSAPLSLVEIGSYQGKSTVLLGSVAKSCSREAKVYAIDPHEGKVGATDQGLHALKPTYDLFQNNIRQAGLSGVVETIREYSYRVKWEKPVSLLFIDGLHDYPNVARDFGHFSGWVQQGGYIVFHDYADYYPGVLALVNEVLQNGDYRKVRQADSLVVVQKK